MVSARTSIRLNSLFRSSIMVGNITSLTGRGLRDWLIQRVTALVIFVYIVVLGCFWFSHPHIHFMIWHDFFACTGMKILNSVMWLSMVLHAWIGLWTVSTDYLKCLTLRLTVQMLILLSLLSLFFWGILVFWGV